MYIALLDIQKTYDSVPNEAIRLTLERLAIPKKIIDLILSLQTNRSITIDTPYGPTELFQPEQGLPQGDVISCLLWNIFYDPLLTRLQQLNQGYKFNQELKISELAL